MMTDRRIMMSKRNNSREATDIEELNEMIQLQVMLKKTLNKMMKEKKHLEEKENEAFLEVSCQKVEAEKLHNDKEEQKV